MANIGENSQCESSIPLKSLRDWISTSKELFTQERLNEYYSHDRVSKIDLKSIAKKIELAQLQSQKFEKLSIKLDQIAHAIVDLKKPSAEEDSTEFEERYKILFNELVTAGNKLDQMKIASISVRIFLRSSKVHPVRTVLKPSQ